METRPFWKRVAMGKIIQRQHKQIKELEFDNKIWRGATCALSRMSGITEIPEDTMIGQYYISMEYIEAKKAVVLEIKRDPVDDTTPK
jgi:hypothetical protein